MCQFSGAGIHVLRLRALSSVPSAGVGAGEEESLGLNLLTI